MDACVGTIFMYLDRIGARFIRKLRYTLSYICTIGKDLEMENKNKKGYVPIVFVYVYAKDSYKQI